MQPAEVNNFLNGKTALVTGATGAIGSAVARKLAGHNFNLVLACRNETKAQKTVQEIIRKTGNHRIRYEIVDLSLRKSILDFASRWEGSLHVLINNAAETPATRQATTEGIEVQFATNVLGYFHLIEEFSSFLKKSAPARIINIASYWAGDLDIDDLEFINRPYNNNMAYRQSKQANRMLTVAFAKRFKHFGVTVNACHPDDVNSRLSNNLGFGGSASPDQGAETPVWLATSEQISKITGRYFEHLQEVKCPFSSDTRMVDLLYNICRSYKEENLHLGNDHV